MMTSWSGPRALGSAAAACVLMSLLTCAGCDAHGAAQKAPKTHTRLADVRGVRATGKTGAYTFHVTVASPDESCRRYADWWEVLRPDGKLVYRRILRHSHKSEQPFTRAGGPVHVKATDRVIVRAHMHPGGYGGRAQAGTVAGGFAKTKLRPGFASGLEHAEPLPHGCLF